MSSWSGGADRAATAAPRLLNPETTAAVLLGASDWSRAGMGLAPSFFRSSRAVLRYLIDGRGLGLDPELVLDLFDDPASAGDQLDRLSEELNGRLRARKTAGRPVSDLLVHYVGRGHPFDKVHLALMVRRSSQGFEAETGIRAPDLARVLRAAAPQQRRLLMLDCCFSEAAVLAFVAMGAREEAVAATTAEDIGQALPERGGLLLCSSPAGQVSIGEPNAPRTLFTGALLSVLEQGATGRPSVLSFADLRDAAHSRMQEAIGAKAPRPALHPVNQAHGDLSRLPAFPNRAAVAEPASPPEAQPEPRPAPRLAGSAAGAGHGSFSVFSTDITTGPAAVGRPAQQVQAKPEPESVPPAATRPSAAVSGAEQEAPHSPAPTPKMTKVGTDPAVQFLRVLAGIGSTFALLGFVVLVNSGEPANLPNAPAVTASPPQPSAPAVTASPPRPSAPAVTANPPQPSAPAVTASPPRPSAPVVTASPPQPSAAKLRADGWRAEIEGNDAEAARLYRLAADLGNATAQINLGIFYENGQGGLAKDEREAARLYRLAADQGNANAQTRVGFFYANGRGGLAKDEREAVRLYRLAADQGNANGQTSLGIFYLEGRGGLQRDDREAARLFRLAADQGEKWAKANLGVLYEEGRGGLARDREQAVSLYQEAARAGNALAQQRLRRLNRAW